MLSIINYLFWMWYVALTALHSFSSVSKQDKFESSFKVLCILLVILYYCINSPKFYKYDIFLLFSFVLLLFSEYYLNKIYTEDSDQIDWYMKTSTLCLCLSNIFFGITFVAQVIAIPEKNFGFHYLYIKLPLLLFIFLGAYFYGIYTFIDMEQKLFIILYLVSFFVLASTSLGRLFHTNPYSYGLSLMSITFLGGYFCLYWIFIFSIVRDDLVQVVFCILYPFGIITQTQAYLSHKYFFYEMEIEKKEKKE